MIHAAGEKVLSEAVGNEGRHHCVPQRPAIAFAETLSAASYSAVGPFLSLSLFVLPSEHLGRHFRLESERPRESSTVMRAFHCDRRSPACHHEDVGRSPLGCQAAYATNTGALCSLLPLPDGACAGKSVNLLDKIRNRLFNVLNKENAICGRANSSV